MPSTRGRGERLATIPGRVPSLSALPPGCKFHPRCAYVHDACARVVPASRGAGAAARPLRRSSGTRVRRARPQRRVPIGGASEARAGRAGGRRRARDERPLVRFEVCARYFGTAGVAPRPRARPADPAVRAVDGVDSSSAGGGPRPRGRVRLRQDDARQDDPAARARRRRASRLRRRKTSLSMRAAELRRLRRRRR